MTQKHLNKGIYNHTYTYAQNPGAGAIKLLDI